MADLPESSIVDFGEYKKKRSRGEKKPGRMQKVIFILLLCSLLFFAYYFKEYLTVEGMTYLAAKIENVFVPGSQAASFNKESMRILFSAAGKNLMENYKKNLILFSSDGLRIYNEWGREEHYVSVFAERPVLQTNDKYIMLYGTGARKLFVVHDGELVREMIFDSDLLLAKMNPVGRIVTAREQIGYKGVLSAFSPSFEETFRWYSASRQITDADIYLDGGLLCAAVVSTEQSRLLSSVLFFDTAQAADPFTETTLGNEYPAEVRFKSSSIAAAVTDMGLYLMMVSGKEKHGISFEGDTLLFYDIVQKDQNVVVTKGLSPACRVAVYDDAGNERFSVSYEKEVTGLSVKPGLIAIAFSDEVKIYSPDGEEKGIITGLKSEIEEISLLTNTMIAIADQKGVLISAF